MEGVNISQLKKLCNELFVDPIGEPYYIPQFFLDALFRKFDTNSDGVLSMREFKKMWSRYMHNVINPSAALIIVDVQNDFIDGSLALSSFSPSQQPAEIIPIINNLLDTVSFNCVVYTQDWHPPDHISFIDNLGSRNVTSINNIQLDVLSEREQDALMRSAKNFDYVTFLLPPERGVHIFNRHCVQNTRGAELHPDLKILPGSIRIHKGKESDVDAYSVFWDNERIHCTQLHEILQSRGITDVYVCGLAYDVCVIRTALDALKMGYRVVVINDACRGTDPEMINKVKREFIEKNGVIVNSEKVADMVSGKDRPVELAISKVVHN